MNIDWSKAPEGAQWHSRGDLFDFWYKEQGDVLLFEQGGKWLVSRYKTIGDVQDADSRVTPRPSEQPSYSRDAALQFLVERLDSWPTDIADAPLCPGWGWVRSRLDGVKFVRHGDAGSWMAIHHHHWNTARPDFVPFVSLEDAQPAPDMVNHPPHYQSDNGIECIDAIRAALGHDGFVSYCTGNAIKYLWRDKTDRAEDLRKAVWYLNRAIREVSGDAQTDR